MCARIYNSLANFEADGVRLLHSHSIIGQRQREEGRDSSAYVHESFARTYFIPPRPLQIKRYSSLATERAARAANAFSEQ